MNVRGSFAAACLVVGAASGCVAQAGADETSEEPPPREEPLDLTIDSLDVVHGALRISATMVDGSADVSVRLGGRCERREVGGGVSTLSGFVWALGDRDVADAIDCGLVVYALARDSAGYVNKLAALDVQVGLELQTEDPTADDEPSGFPVPPTELAWSVLRAQPLTVGRRSFATSISIGGTSIQADPQEPDEVPEEP
jgi:hypothetical protein